MISILATIGPMPSARIIVPLIFKSHGNPITHETSEFFAQTVAQFLD
jgi:hypothetical protein